jgi:glycosyltransferase involved in cell wall biosynthesis
MRDCEIAGLRECLSAGMSEGGGWKEEDRLQTTDHGPQTSGQRSEWLLRTAMRVRGILLGRGKMSEADVARWRSKRRQIRILKRMLRTERPDIIHVKGRIIAEAWGVLPPERTIFHIATSGACDPSWDVAEVAAFRSFIERCAVVFAPGSGVAERFKREFGIQREVVPVCTMAPEAGGEPPADHWRQTTDHGLQTTDHGLRTPEAGKPETTDHGLRTTDHRPQTTDYRLQTTDNGGTTAERQEDGLSSVVSRQSSVIRFGFVGRLAAGKGILETVEALALLKSERVEPPFVFVGDGPLAGELRAAIFRCGLTRATLAGVLPPGEAVRQMDVLVLASESEAMPLVLVEALSAGHPCVATRVGGIPDLIRDGVEGVLLQDATPASIAAAMRRVLAMPAESFRAMSGRAKARYEDCCTPVRVGALVERQYRDVMAQSGSC